MAEGGCLQPHPQCFCLELGLMEAQKQHPAGKTRCRFMVLNGWSVLGQPCSGPAALGFLLLPAQRHQTAPKNLRKR